MQHRRFGSTQREVLVIGRATWYIEDKDRDAAIEALRTGIDLRTNETNTAEMYEKHGVAVVACSPFGPGSFPGPRTAGGRVLQQITASHHASCRQVGLQFLLRRPGVFAIPKASAP
jgi:diketogulonate reductase-like aldo/keto reductase